MKGFIIDLARSLGLYVLVVVGGVFCFLSLAPLVGYLPYSDRPGPGWLGRAANWREFLGGVGFLLAWAPMMLPHTVTAGSILFLIARALERFGTPRLAVAIIAAVLAGFASGYLVLAFGWYIAIAEPPVYFAMALGIVFGAWLLPRPQRYSNSTKPS